MAAAPKETGKGNVLTSVLLNYQYRGSNTWGEDSRAYLESRKALPKHTYSLARGP